MSDSIRSRITKNTLVPISVVICTAFVLISIVLYFTTVQAAIKEDDAEIRSDVRNNSWRVETVERRMDKVDSQLLKISDNTAEILRRLK